MEHLRWTEATKLKYIVYYSDQEETPTMFQIFNSMQEAEKFVKDQECSKPWHITMGVDHG